MKDPYQIIQLPLVTEKSSLLRSDGVYVFRVHSKATKPTIRSAVERLFSVKVLDVNTVSLRGKSRGRLTAHSGATGDWKKAYVRIAPGEKIKLLEENA